MAHSSKKVLYISLGILLVFACVPLTNILQPTEVPSTPLLETATGVTFSQAPTSSSTSVPGSTNTPGIEPTLPPISSDLYAFIQAPEGPVPLPYVTLFGFQAIPEILIEISGVLNSREFICRGSPCALPVDASSILVFRARSSVGSISEDVSATIRVEQGSDGYYVYVDTVSQFSVFADACLRFWDFRDLTNPVWAEFVQFPYQLNTDKTLHYLTTQLIIHGVVDVAGCPAGGLNISLNWPTGCGLERAAGAMVEWQNKYDEYIWLASKNIGIPPKILKTVIEVESQFWPGNQRFFVDEVGLGQINQLGVDVLLRRDPLAYQQACNAVLDDCSMPYTLLSSQNQAMIRGALISSLNAVCPDCQYGIDLTKARESVTFIAQVLRANCQTVKILIDNRTYNDFDVATATAGALTAIAKNSDEELEDLEIEPADLIDDPYTDYWKFTLLAYHSGVSCFENAIKNTPIQKLDWAAVSENVECKGGVDYVDGVWGNLLNFEQYRFTTANREIEQVSPVFAPTPTPIPTKVPEYSEGQVRVQVFMDRNGNGSPDGDEWLEGIPVILQTENTEDKTGTTENGVIVFSLEDVRIGTQATVTLQGLYRSELFTVPALGDVSIEFMFEAPVLPTEIP